MNLAQIESHIQKLLFSFSEESFIYDFLLAYGFPKSTITLIKSGQRNMAKKEGEIILKNKLYFTAVTDGSNLLAVIDALDKDITNHRHKPRFFIVTDFTTLLSVDTKTRDTLECPIADLGKHVHFFLPLTGTEKTKSKEENPADIKAAYTMAKLYDEILTDNHIETDEERHALNVFLSRLLFCFFAEDTGIFTKDIFSKSLDAHTQLNGSDMHTYLEKLFKILDTSTEKRPTDTPTYLTDFPYVNGDFFKKRSSIPHFNPRSRRILIECGRELDWQHINPDIFGSMVQAVVHKDQRSSLGMHYTSVSNIQKVIKPLFLDALRHEYASAKDSPKKLQTLLNRLTKIRIFDPACGSGNFLIIAYKELRRLEIEIFQDLVDANVGRLPISDISLSQFYGIEIDDFACEIAGLSLYLAEHQMHREFAGEFHVDTKTLPLKASGNIHHANATRIEWDSVCPRDIEYEIYIVGNPPYLGSRNQNATQKEDMKHVLKKDYKSLDYIACWFVKGAQYITNTSAKMALVSTNSICQGEQVALLWPRVLQENLEIVFAHTSFKWDNHAKKNAGVTVIIVGIANKNDKQEKYIYGESGQKKVTSISPYLTEGKTSYIYRRSQPLSSSMPPMFFGNMPNDGGNLVLSTAERNSLIQKYPDLQKNIRKFLGAQEFLNGQERFCLWIDDANLQIVSKMPEIAKRLQNIQNIRMKSTEKSTRAIADRPHKFYFSSHKETSSIIIPSATSERREYIPMGFLDSRTIISNLAQAIYDAEPWIFGVISSRMHMVWVRAVAGRLKTDYRYSSALCYNTFPIPPLTDEQKQMITHNVKNVLAERERHSEKTMAQMYDPDKMPAGLRDAHRMLDELIDGIYRALPFQSDEERLAYLFRLYERMVEGVGKKK